jgi:hypothetical protein
MPRASAHIGTQSIRHTDRAPGDRGGWRCTARDKRGLTIAANADGKPGLGPFAPFVCQFGDLYRTTTVPCCRATFHLSVVSLMNASTVDEINGWNPWNSVVTACPSSGPAGRRGWVPLGVARASVAKISGSGSARDEPAPGDNQAAGTACSAGSKSAGGRSHRGGLTHRGRAWQSSCSLPSSATTAASVITVIATDRSGRSRAAQTYQ